MTRVPAASEQTPTAAAANQLADRRDAHAHFADLREIYAHFPESLRAVDIMYELMIGQGVLSRDLRELVFAAASDARGDHYLARAMCEQAADHRGVSADEAYSICRLEPGATCSEGEHALLAFSRKAAEVPYKMIQRDVDEVLQAGFSNRGLVEALTLVCLSGYMNVMSLSVGLDHQKED